MRVFILRITPRKTPYLCDEAFTVDHVVLSGLQYFRTPRRCRLPASLREVIRNKGTNVDQV